MMMEEGDGFKAFSVNDEFVDQGGVYVFCKKIKTANKAKFLPLYVGQTQSLANRLTNSHHKWEEAINLGMSHILIEYEEDKDQRLKKEAFLWGFYDPCLND